MLFYISLFIACVISAILVLYLYHLLTDLGRAVYKGLLPSSKNNATSHLERVRSGSKANGSQAPWGWKGSDHKTREKVSKFAPPIDTAGLDGFLNKVGNEPSSVGWPYREDKVGFAGTAYKVKRTTTASKQSRPGTNSKQPWGW